MKTMNRWLASTRSTAAVSLLCGIVAGTLVPLMAHATTPPVPTSTPSVKIGTAALISPGAADTFYGTATTSSTSIGSYAAPKEVVELARSLDNNVDLIYEFVRNNIDVAWMYGAQKGALGAITDRSGTPFDQAMLMVALLRQAGYTASYQAGTISLTPAQFLAWTNISSAQAACQLLSSGGIPATINGSTPVACSSYGSAAVSSILMSHIWVAATIPGATCSPCLFDPSYKTYTFKAGVNLVTATGLSTGAAMTQSNPTTTSVTGPGNDVNYIKGLNSSGTLTSLLNGYGQSLLTSIQANEPAGEIEDLVGGAIIQAYVTPAGGLRQGSLPYSATAQHTWTSGIPDQYRTSMGVQITMLNSVGTYSQIITNTLFIDEIYGRKLNFRTTYQPNNTTTFNGFLELVDEFGNRTGLTSYTENYAASQENPGYLYGFITLSAMHPYAASATPGSQTTDGTYMDESVTKYVSYSTPFTILHGWGDVGRGGINEKWGTRLDQGLFPLQTNACETCSSSYFSDKGDGRREQLAASWLAQSSRAARLNAAIAHSVYTHHHSIGVVAADSVVDQINLNPPGSTASYAYSLSDSYDRIDVESGISVTSTTAVATDRRAALFAIAATSEALEASVVAQVAQMPDTSSTATRFEWGNAPPNTGPNSEDPNCAPGSAPCARGFLEFTPNNYTELSTSGNTLLKMAGLTTTPAAPLQNVTQCLVGGLGAYSGSLASTIGKYAQQGFDVVASEESFLGPGQQCGSAYPVYPARSQESYRRPSMQRGGALVATLYDSNGLDPLQIAHVVVGPNESSKGGGGGVEPTNQAVYDPSKAADVLKSRFVDRSKVLGVDLQTGKVSATSPASLKIGNGDFPYSLTAQLIWRGGDVQDSRFGPIVHTEPQAPWTTNWNNTLTMSGSGLETMGDGDLRATAGTVAAFLALQDVYKSAPSAHREVAAVLVAAWWARQLAGNVVTANVGADTRQFVSATPWQVPASATWIATGAGSYAQLKISGNRAAAMSDCNGPTTTDYQLSRGWDPSGMSFAITNAHGDIQNFGYWSAGIIDQSSSTWCAYQKGFRLNSWSFPQGMNVTLTYTAGTAFAPPELASVSNSLGKSISFTSSGLGGFVSSDGRQVGVTTSVDTSGNETDTHTDPASEVNTFLSASVGGKYLLNTIYTADNLYNGNATSPNAGSTQYLYDSMERVKLASDAVALRQGTRSPYQFNIAEGLRGERIDPLGARYTVYYDNRKRSLRYIDELAHVTAMTHDGRGRVTTTTYPMGDQEQFTYDDHNNPTGLTKIPYTSGVPGQPASIGITASWDQTWNKPAWIKDAKGQETDFTYYAAGTTGASLIHTATQPAVSNQGGANASPVWAYTYNTLGQPSTSLDPTGLLTQDNYFLTSGATNYGYLQSTVVDSGASPHYNLTTSYTYDAAGNALTVTDGRGKTSTSTYDNDRRVLTTTGPSYATLGIKTENTYQGGLLVKTRKAAVVGASESTDTGWQVSSTIYTPTRKPWIVTDPSGYEAITAYDGDDRATDLTQCLTTGSGSNCPGASRTTHTSYYADGTTNQVFKGWGSSNQITYSTTTYDADSKPLTVADANGNVTRTVYDGYERSYRLCYPDSTAASCTVTGSPADYEQYTSYDLNGNLLTKRNRDGVSLTFVYDALNHETTRTVPANLNGHFARSLTSTYDLAGRPWSETADGQTLSMLYDSAKRLGGVTDSLLNALGSNIGNMAYSYDAASNRTGAVVYTAGTSWGPAYIYDDAERLSGVNSSSAVATYTLDPLSRRTAETLYGGSSASYAYWPNNDLQTLTHNWSGGSLSLGFTENGAHQIIGQTLNDNSYEMQSTTPGNTYTVNALNQYTSINGTTPTYDANGNLKGDGTWVYEYDEENRLRTANGNGHVVSYDYDPQGRRRAKTVDGTITYFVSDGPNEVAELSSAGARQRLYVYGNGPDDRIAMYTDAGSTWDIYHTDHHGSTLAMIRGNTLLTSYRYGPYGESQDALTGNPFRYTGRYLDAETGLYYYRARFYDPKTGRFLQTDSIGGKDDLNLYSYTKDDPVNGTDPTGTSCSGSLLGDCDSVGSSSRNQDSIDSPDRGGGQKTANQQKMQEVRQKGQEGERQSGVDQSQPKERVESRSGTAKYRVIDKSSKTTMEETKNVKEFRITDQIRDFVQEAFASAREFIVNLRSNTSIGPAAQQYIEENGIKVQRPIQAQAKSAQELQAQMEAQMKLNEQEMFIEENIDIP